MAKIRITKEFQFEMAHALWNYDGKCKNIHGHTYRLFVSVLGEPLNDPNDHKNGMVMDFGNLKKIIKQEIFDKHDHFVALNANSPHSKINFSDFDVKNVQLKNYQPTCENMVVEFVELVRKHLPPQVELVMLRLYETQTSFAEWRKEDNM